VDDTGETTGGGRSDLDELDDGEGVLLVAHIEGGDGVLESEGDVRGRGETDGGDVEHGDGVRTRRAWVV